MKKAIGITLLLSALSFPAHAQARPPLLDDVPCWWFVKTPPGVWSTDHVIRVDQLGLVAGRLSFVPGLYRVDDGTDAYEAIERKCGHGPVPDDVYRSAMPLPFGIFPWYR